MMKKEISLTIKPTLDCNMKCKHCFNGDEFTNSPTLSLPTIYRFLELAAQEYMHVKITFHGGEPSLMGPVFYKYIFNYEKELHEKYNTQFYNNFTTNSLALTDTFMDILIDNNTLINVSYDGPYNDVLRQNSAIIRHRLERLQEKGARLRVYCTISAQSYRYLKEIYIWFKEHKIDFKILPIQPRGYAYHHRELLMDTDSFIKELISLYRYWLTDTDNPIIFYTFQEFSRLRRELQFKSFWFNRKLALNPDGKIYPFGRPNDVGYCLGRPEDIVRLSDCFQAPPYTRLLSTLQHLIAKTCPSCPSSHACNGVCLCMSYVYGSEVDALTYECNMSSSIFREVLTINDELLKNAKKNNIERFNPYVQQQLRQTIQ